MNNTKKQTYKQDQKNKRQTTRQGHEPKKQGRNPNALQNGSKYQEHEYPEMRLTR